ncbi:MAG: hypothetical protein IT423_17450 [Pirellulaceae bacterium]|nr:hypothetical protein [Pirellulaceae bacterium]
MLGWLTAWFSLGESLWLDELHTTWCVSGSFGEVQSRAAIGNQLPLYFWWQWGISQTFGTSEAVWRATSLVSWLGLVTVAGVVIWRWSRAIRCPELMLVLCLALVDRNQIFYATEARPYASMALAILAAWCALAGWLSPDKSSSSRSYGRAWLWWCAWLGLNALAFWLQPTAVLSWAAQFVYLIGRWINRVCISARDPSGSGHDASSNQTLATIAGAGVLLLVMWPARYVLEPVWTSRAAWSAFAADTSPINLVRQLPLIACVGPILVARVASWIWSRDGSAVEGHSNQPDPSNTSTSSQASQFRPCIPRLGVGWMWMCAWGIPLALVFLSTSTGLAALVHPRYLFACAMPLVVWSACSLADCTARPNVRVALVIAMFILLTIQQGTLNAWIHVRLPVAMRGEDWRGAIALISRKTATTHAQIEQLSPHSPIVWCASNLIEGAKSQPLESGSGLMASYLSLPLRTIYYLPSQTQIVPLLNDPRSWSKAMDAWETASAGSDRKLWLVVRSGAQAFARRLTLSGLQPVKVHDFGGVQVMELR